MNLEQEKNLIEHKKKSEKVVPEQVYRRGVDGVFKKLEPINNVDIADVAHMGELICQSITAPETHENIQIIGQLEFFWAYNKPFTISGDVGPGIIIPLTNLAAKKVYGLIGSMQENIHMVQLLLDRSTPGGVKTDEFSPDWKRAAVQAYNTSTNSKLVSTVTENKAQQVIHPYVIAMSAYKIMDLTVQTRDMHDDTELADGINYIEAAAKWQDAMNALHKALTHCYTVMSLPTTAEGFGFMVYT